MREAERIAGQLRRAFEGESWHGPAVMELLRDVTAAQGAARPVAGAHSIWELVLHIGAWEAIAVRRAQGEAAADVPTDVDWPPVTDTSEPSWARALETLREGNRRARQAIAALTDEDLSRTVTRQAISVRAMLHGVVHHHLYHAGQIAILKKAAATLTNDT